MSDFIMTKQEQIEEMANYYCEYCKKQTGEKFCEHIDDKSCNIFFEAELFYNAGYRKVPEDAVVLTGRELTDRTGEIWGQAQEQARKETAKEILLSLRRFLIERFDYFGMLAKRNEEVNSDNRIFDLGEQDMANCTLDRVNELLEKYGVEVEE